jgi:G3E family GTPase
MSTIGLIDPKRLSVFKTEGIERDQLDAADVLLLSKSDIATEDERKRFYEEAQACFPPKRLIGTSAEALLTPESLAPPKAIYAFAMRERPKSHRDAHLHSMNIQERSIKLGSTTASATVHKGLDREACGWTLPRELVFNRVQLHESLLHDHGQLLSQVDRLKAVLRTGIEHWTLFNVSPGGVMTDPCGWRQDSRIEVQLKADAQVDWILWDRYWESMLAR